ncbi:hypothetical protein WH52_14075 [Tenacibaculum holothuriorum]|uniref:Uncharacterized protein n=1 Tax=Tenacibaculum holothuriorum TaxID=1635173 RepID=A0A1Y2PAS9_9FLAO|nr:hypothetical protein [Tenacibaculum holothuriorum]OSY86907.1 hypothetical protein WH52_14075 [Tenacibaculum holothuriorum]
MQLKSGEAQKLAMIYSELEKEKSLLLKTKNIPNHTKKVDRQLRIVKTNLLSIKFSLQEIIKLLKNK